METTASPKGATATVRSAVLLGASAHRVKIRARLDPGPSGFEVIGIADHLCRELRDRIRAALLSSGIEWPAGRVMIDMDPPPVIPSSSLDLPVATAVLQARGIIPCTGEDYAAFGELGLDGTIRPVAGAVALAEALAGATILVTPAASRTEVGLVVGTPFYAAGTLSDVIRGSGRVSGSRLAATPVDPDPEGTGATTRAASVASELQWPLEVAAAGGHHILIVGRPSDAALIGAALADLLPDLDSGEALQTTRLHSAAGVPLPAGGWVNRPPVRCPHHSSWGTTLLGGGRATRPGELSLAHNGVLVLDGLTEFAVPLLDALRSPLDDASIRLTRGHAIVSLPARIQLVATMLPCPCGRDRGGCVCSASAIRRHVRAVPRWLLDRFAVRLLPREGTGAQHPQAATAAAAWGARQRVADVRERARRRGAPSNEWLPDEALEETATLAPDAAAVLVHELRSGTSTARAIRRVQRVARTLADLDGIDGPTPARHVVMALGLREPAPPRS